MNEREIFEKAIEIADQEQREVFLLEAFDGDRTRAEYVNSLMAEPVESFLEQPFRMLPDTSVKDFAAILVGQQIGPYKLLEVIGEGGMGTVYMASQAEPIRRRVAVKVIKTGMDTRQVIARFEAERQTLALMDHPNISKVLDAGSTESGRPYFVMELVKGIPITRFCDKQQMGLNERLELFQQVCHAVQHAHQKGIIHRDIKPSNVLVAMYDDRPVVKVIDFGVAKATGEQLTDKTMFTRFGQVVGTLEYMSPEQAQFNQLDIDTRSDVYSLGAILCELISGEPPFNKQRLKSQALDETLRMIREEEPTKPSTKLSSSAQLAQVASNRDTTAEKLSSQLRGDLDWIVMKALDKDRSERYETANELAKDIERYCLGKPVLATPPSVVYRLKKFAAANKVAMAFATLLGLFLAFGVVGLTISNFMLSRQSARAERNLDYSLDAIERMLVRVADYDLRDQPGSFELRKGLYDDALAISESIIQFENTSPNARRRIAAAYFNVGRINHQLENPETAAVAYRKSIDQWKSWLNEFPDHELAEDGNLRLAKTHFNYAQVLRGQGSFDAAKLEFHEADEIRTRIFSTTGKMDAEVAMDIAMAEIEYAAMLRETNQLSLTKSHYERGIELIRRVIALEPENADHQIWLAWAYHHFANAQFDLGTPADAKVQIEAAIEILDRWSDKANDQKWANQQLCESHEYLARLLLDSGQPQAAQPHISKSLGISKQLKMDYPGLLGPSFTLARLTSLEADMYGQLNAIDLAIEKLEITTELYRELGDKKTDNQDFKNELANGLRQLAFYYGQKGQKKLVHAKFDEAISVRQQLIKQMPDEQSYRYSLANLFEVQARVVQRYLGDFKLAESSARRGLKIIDALVAEQPNEIRYGILQVSLHSKLGSLYLESEQYQKALKENKIAVQLAEPLREHSIPKPLESYDMMMVRLECNLATSYCTVGEFNNADRVFVRASETLEKRIANRKATPDDQINYAGIHNNLSNLYEEYLNDLGRAVSHSKVAIETYQNLLSDLPGNEQIRSMLAESLFKLARIYGNFEKTDESLVALEEAIRQGYSDSPEKIRLVFENNDVTKHDRFKQILDRLKSDASDDGNLKKASIPK